MGKDYEVGSEAPDLIFTSSADIYSSGTIYFNDSTATGVDDLLWEWDDEFAQLDLPLEFNLSDIEIIEDHINLRTWEDFDSEEQTQKEIESFRKRLDDPEI